ncbi:MAG: hypothetical protein WD003_02560 [Candidatus Paceibacterota bacterium]
MFLKKKRFRSPEKRQQQRHILTIRALLVLGLVITSLVALAFFSHLPQLAVTHISIVGSELTKKEESIEIVQRYLDRNILALLASSNIFFIPREKIQKELLATYPQIQKSFVKRDTLKSITLHLVEYKPLTLFCGEVPTNTEAPCYFVSPEGVIFFEAPRFSGGVYLEIYGKISERKTRNNTNYSKPLGYFLLEKGLFQRLTALLGVFDAMELRYQKLLYDENNDAQLILENGVEIRFVLTQNFETLLSDLDAAFESGEITLSQLQASDSLLEYVDMRFDNRVFFK